MRQALVFGASGQIGAALLRRLLDAGWQVIAVSREVRDDESPGLRWVQGDLAHCEGLPVAIDAIFSCGPLDLFADWYANRSSGPRSEEHTSELQSLMRISYAVFCLTKKKRQHTTTLITTRMDIRNIQSHLLQ